MNTNPRSLIWFHRIEQVELPLCAYVNRAGNLKSLNLLFRSVSRLGDGLFWYSLIIAILLLYGRNAVIPALQTGLSAGVGVLVYKTLKERLVRERPFVTHEVIRCNARSLDQYSFPSGHTLHAVNFSILLVWHYPVLAWMAIPFAVLVALSRVVLGLHYISDVLVGGLIGAMIAVVSLYIASPYLM